MANTIEIDFDVFKALTMQRESEETTYNDVLRKLLKLPPKQSPPAAGGKEVNSVAEESVAWVSKGVAFPSGTLFRKTYKGSLHSAKVEEGKLVLNGKSYDSLSSAAMSITKSNVDGWSFWDCKRPGESWVIAKALRA
jgi:negative regulator of replication initiation